MKLVGVVGVQSGRFERQALLRVLQDPIPFPHSEFFSASRHATSTDTGHHEEVRVHRPEGLAKALIQRARRRLIALLKASRVPSPELSEFYRQRL
jgi:hypothetical protein